jgi:hypothetical protein
MHNPPYSTFVPVEMYSEQRDLQNVLITVLRSYQCDEDVALAQR